MQDVHAASLEEPSAATPEAASSPMTQLDRFLEALEEDMARSVDPLSTTTRDTLGPILRGGKRLRPQLTYLAGSIGPVDSPVLQRLATVVELLHTASLIHDDVIDRSTSRRGIPTLHHSFGPGVATTAGAYLLHDAAVMTRDMTEAAVDQRRKIRESVARTIVDLCSGQLQEFMNIGNTTVDEATYLSTIEKKTASLFELSCRLGALATEGPTRALASFGWRFGTMYQVADDLRDILCTEKELGKRPASDLRSGIYTMPVIHTLAEGSERARALAAILANRSRRLTDSQVDEAISLIRGGDGARSAAATARELGEAARQALAPLPPSWGRQALERLVGEVATGLDRFVAQ